MSKIEQQIKVINGVNNAVHAAIKAQEPIFGRLQVHDMLRLTAMLLEPMRSVNECTNVEQLQASVIKLTLRNMALQQELKQLKEK